jgi:hypothetical protein
VRKTTHLIYSLTSKVHLPLWTGLLILIAVDLITRINVTPVQQNKPWEDEKATRVIADYISEAEATKISFAINNYEVQSSLDEVPGDNYPSVTEQNAQQGDMHELFSGEMRYRLMGIFKKSTAFAVIEQENLLTNEQKIIKITLSSSLNNYQVNDISANKVIFSSQEGRQVSLYLYNKTN